MFGFIDGEQDVGLLGHVGQAHGTAFAQRVMAGQPQAALGVEQNFRDDIRVGKVGGQHHGHVELAVEQALFDGLALLFEHLDGYVRMPMLHAL